MTTDPSTHLFWITSRAAGIVALLVASVSVSVGLLMSTRVAGRRLRGPDLRVLHEVLSISTIVAIAVHALSLLGDQYLRASFIDVTVPFVSGYKTVWTTLGIMAGWSMVALGLSYYARGQDRSRSAGVRCTGSPRSPGCSGSCTRSARARDAGQAWFLAMTAIVVLPALVLLVRRLTMPAGKPSADGRVVKRPANAARRHGGAAGEALGEAVHS